MKSAAELAPPTEPASNYAGKFGLNLGRLRGDYEIELDVRVSGTPNQSTVTGRATRSGGSQIEIRGTYFNTTKRIKAFGEVRGLEGAFSINIDGAWYPSSDVLALVVKASDLAQGGTPENVQCYLSAGGAHTKTELDVSVSPTSTRWGQNVGGEATVTARGVTNPTKVEVRGYVTYQYNTSTTLNTMSGTRVVIDCPRDGQYKVDLSRLGINLPAGAEDPKCVVVATIGGTSITGSARINSDAGEEPLAIAYLTTFGGGAGKVGIKGKFGLHYIVTNSSNQERSAQVTERIRFGLEGGAMSNLPDYVWTAKASASAQTIRPDDAPRFVDLDFPREGRYRVEYEVSGPGVTGTRGFVTIDVTRAPASGTPIRKGDIRGTIEFDNSSPKEGEPVVVRFSQTLSGATYAVVTEEITAYGPSGSVVASETIRATMMEGQTYSPKWVFNGREQGNYRIVARITGETIQPFQAEGSIRVSPKPAEGATSGSTGATGQAVQGTYGLVKKELGVLPSGQGDPYGNWSGSISATSFSGTWTATNYYEGSFTFQGSWDTPPSVLKPGDVIELKVSARASRTSTNQPYHGGNAEWWVEGAAILQKGNSFAGSATDGNFYGSTDTTLRVKIGSGGKVVLTAGVALPFRANPCTYTYEWNAPPIQDSGSDADDPLAGRPSGLFRLQSDLMEEDGEVAKLEARVVPASITLRAGGMAEILNVYVSGFRKRTDDRVTITFPQKTDGWASLPGGIVVTGGDGSYWPPNMGRPEHSDGFFFRARDNAPSGSQTINIVVSQEGAGSVVLQLVVNVIGRTSAPPTNPTGVTWQGAWESNFDTLTLTQNGNQVSGVFGVDKNRVTGTANGNVLTLKVYIGNEEFGTAKLTMAADGKSFKGEIAVAGSNEKLEWSGTRK